ncbi:Protein synthesis factor and Translation elongation factor EFTu EF1A domain containing protein [Aphelenchoides besseyi]|nr:Protein synthesis factor and Translation elongation factor EFTu EF1A domain containing protein [Aphelenchoides besseyi]KAI6202162.1 Protein synthesis factor and Translation elongation factor EFTu EF1A domain containing protein [Aphelenchoides besseyi]
MADGFELEPEPSALHNRFLLDQNPEALERYEEHLNRLLIEGEGEALIEIGVPYDDEFEAKGLSKEELEKAETVHNEIIGSKLNCVTTGLLTKSYNGSFSRISIIRKNLPEEDFLEIRVAVVGNVDAGKSTFLGVLTHNALDDGRGQARKKLFRHQHEFETGRTSSVGNDILGFDVHGKVVNAPDKHSGRLNWLQISRAASKILTFIDLAGHEKYLKTTIFGLTGHQPDYTMLMIGANMGISGMTKEHLSLCLALNVPVFVVITKIDYCPENVLDETLKQLNKLLRSPGSRKLPVVVNNMEDIFMAAQHFYQGRMCPIFRVSNVTGENLDKVRTFLNILPIRRTITDQSKVLFVIDEVFWVDGVGTVVSGNCVNGTVRVNDTLWLGPDSTGNFVQVPIKSIHRKRMPVDSVRHGQSAAFAIKKVTKKQIRKGMVLLSGVEQPHAVWEFEAEILILNHPTTISRNYEAMVHVGAVRQTAKIMHMKKDVLRTGDRDRVRFRFTRRPEYIRKGTRLVFREGLTKAVGTVEIIISDTSTPQPPVYTRQKTSNDPKKQKPTKQKTKRTVELR